MEHLHSHDSGPRHRAPEHPPTSTATDAAELVNRAIDRATSETARRRLVKLYAEHGPPFAAFTTLPDVDVNAETLELDFLDSHHGSFATPEALVAEHLDAMGWTEALAAFRRTWAIPDGLLTWDQTAAFRGITTHLYDVVEAGGLIHAFAR
ncbi:hypothetical protein [Cellulomonas sp. PS-H5]|uniref:hypothetical protein n=1 Tax=Cellulomonas sp. PS-H5 TaxID=2820400 RepID=UPI001C4E92F3|nr:hypothetical protein [Cellulomonas sp. PS-H5]MBW0252582.1 hypothetical protein [Cellulomonas sp. PS-H5]